MLPFFPPGSQSNPPNGGGASNQNPAQGSMLPPFPMNQAPQFNFPNPANMAMAMAALNQNRQIATQFGLNALAAMQLFGQGPNIQQNMALQMQGQMQNLNFLASLQSASNMVQGLNQMTNNIPILAQPASGFGVPQANQGFPQPGFSGVPQGAHMNKNVSQSNSATMSAAHYDVSGRNFKTNQHSILQTRFQNNNLRQNSRPFSGDHGRGPGALLGRTGKMGQSERKGGAHQGISTVPLENKKKRRLIFTYDAKEVKQWCEARKRNFPTTSNIEKKLAAKRKKAGIEDDDTELRRQQMQEVLAKQEALGFEVAEVPHHYLVGSKNQTQNNRDRTQSRFCNKRGRLQGRGKFLDRRNFHSRCPGSTKNAPDTKAGEPSLLKKLLSTEIKADKHRILHAFRFMVLNSFFDRWPDKQLEFPLVEVTGMESEITEGNEDEMRKLKGENGLDESESAGSENESESVEERESESVGIMGEIEKGVEKEEGEKPEEGEITD